MSIRIIPAKRFTDRGERVMYDGLELLATPTAIIEPNTVDADSWIESDITSIMATLAVANNNITYTKVTDETINVGKAMLLLDMAPCPTDATIHSVVKMVQSHQNLYFTGYVENSPQTDGTSLLVVRIIAHNISTTNQTLANGTALYYSVHNGKFTAKPDGTINPANLIVNPGQAWLDAAGDPLVPPPPVNADTLNATAKPTFIVNSHSITGVELNNAGISSLGARFIGHRLILTVSGNKTITPGAAVTLGTVSFTGSVGPNIAVGQVSPGPLLTGYVSSAGPPTVVTVQGRNTAQTGNQVISSGTQIKVFAY